MTVLRRNALQAFPVEYHRHQVASGVIGVPRRTRRGGVFPSEINFGNSFDYGRNHGADVHNAIDIMGQEGLRVVATTAGVVAHSWRTRSGAHPGIGRTARGTGGGYYVVMIDNSDGYYHYYAHMEDLPLVREGDRIVAGQLLGYLGDTGRARGGPPHLHYQVSVRNKFGGLVRFLNPYEELRRLAEAWDPRVSRGGRVVIPVSSAGPSG